MGKVGEEANAGLHALRFPLCSVDVCVLLLFLLFAALSSQLFFSPTSYLASVL